MTDTKPDLSSLRIDRDPPPPTSRPGTGRARAVGFVAAALAALAAVWWFALRPQAPEVRVAIASATGGGTLSGEGITANGYVVARTKASVSAEVMGRLEYLGVTEGTRVRRGEIIARIESGDYVARVAAARAEVASTDAQLAQARRDLERAKTLAAQQVISDAELEDRRTALDVLDARLRAARAQLELAAVSLENTRVRAPFDGTVLRKDAEQGEIVAPSSAGGGLTRTAIVTMADLGTLEVEVDVNEAYIARIRNGQPGRITLDAYPDTSFAGRVRQVVPTADRQKATVLVKVAILDRDPRILPEMGAKVLFLREASEAATAAAPRRVLVPSAAVRREANGAAVWLVENDRATRRAVELGTERGEDIEIRKGLEGGERVVLDPPASLKDGAAVRVARSS
jgi:RND family efflux transporter MFP subunit